VFLGFFGVFGFAGFFSAILPPPPIQGERQETAKSISLKGETLTVLFTFSLYHVQVREAFTLPPIRPASPR